ncbi:hypothetical protein D0T98_17485, partial [Burkholderia pseudomallei]
MRGSGEWVAVTARARQGGQIAREGGRLRGGVHQGRGISSLAEQMREIRHAYRETGRSAAEWLEGPRRASCVRS